MATRNPDKNLISAVNFIRWSLKLNEFCQLKFPILSGTIFVNVIETDKPKTYGQHQSTTA